MENEFVITPAVTQICHFPVSETLKTDTCRKVETNLSGKTLFCVLVSFSS